MRENDPRNECRGKYLSCFSDEERADLLLLDVHNFAESCKFLCFCLIIFLFFYPTLYVLRYQYRFSFIFDIFTLSS